MKENNHTFQDKVDALSDEFGSTFTTAGEHILANMFAPAERPFVEALVKKHMGATEVECQSTGQLTPEYDIWLIRWK